jgi:hypothetical protein
MSRDREALASCRALAMLKFIDRLALIAGFVTLFPGVAITQYAPNNMYLPNGQRSIPGNPCGVSRDCTNYRGTEARHPFFLPRPVETVQGTWHNPYLSGHNRDSRSKREKVGHGRSELLKSEKSR